MSERYTKQGATVRWENGTTIRVRESGYAIEDGDSFECAPLQGALAEPPLWTEPQIDFAYERLILTHGIAHHQFGERRWSEETKRLHCAITHGTERVLIDLASFDFDHLREIASLRIGPERSAPPQLRLAPNVTAALLPSLVNLAPPNVTLKQRAGGIDGKGNDIVETIGTNWFRPSYRMRPVRMPLNLELTCDVTEIDETRPRAIALLAPVDGPTLRVLIDDGERPFPAVVRVTRIDAVARGTTWYPYGGGSFGSWLMLRADEASS